MQKNNNKQPYRWRLQLRNFAVRSLLEEYKAANGISELIGLNDKQRADFEAWAIIEGRRRDVDVFGLEEYRKSIIAANAAMSRKRDWRL